MEVEVSYEAAKAAYPNEVQVAVEQLRRSKSRDKDVAVEELRWQYTWAEKMGGASFGELISRVKDKATKTAEERKVAWEADKNKPVADRVNDRIARLVGLSLVGTYHRAGGAAEIPAGSIPAEVHAALTEQEQAAFDEDQRLLGLTEEELKAASEAALKELAKNSGFVAVKVELPEGICCEMRQNASEGYDFAGVGHLSPVHLELRENVWWLTCIDWFSTPIKHCPWCGVLLPTENFELGANEVAEADEDGVDALLDAIEDGMKIQNNIEKALKAQAEQEGKGEVSDG